MNGFPERYSRPVLFGLYNAGSMGWSAACQTGGGPVSGPPQCTAGTKPHNVQVCRNGHLLAGGGGSGGVFNPGAVGNGL